MKKVIYLCSYKHIIKNYDNNYDIFYNDIIDIEEKKYLHFIKADALCIDLSDFDIIIASPPCNYYSRANYRRDISSYSLTTKHLLPNILKKCIDSGKPFLVENVRNRPLFSKLGLFDFGCFVYEIGRHTYWTNICFIPFYNIPISSCNIQNLCKSKREGDFQVHFVIDSFLDFLSMNHE